MNLPSDLRQPVLRTTGSFEPSHPWIISLPASNPRSIAEPASPLYSFMSECECPDDCLRDHENE